jgi:predicted O-methyltransferase YrrM
MDFIDIKIQEYAEKFTAPESELLQALNRETWANVLIPRMLSGHLQGRILAMFSKLIRPKCILEIGTYTGYSALCLAEGLTHDGVLHTIDINEELRPIISKYFTKSGLGSQLQFHAGNALDIIPNLAGPFDLVFIDADKENYSNYFDVVIDRLQSGALIIADNMLWSGKVLDAAAIASDVETRALSHFTKKVHEDERVENVLLPVRDGLMLLRRK